jgi:hypothetical protein
MPLKPVQRRWVLVAVVYDLTRMLHLDAFRDSIIAAVVAKLLDGKIRWRR